MEFLVTPRRFISLWHPMWTTRPVRGLATDHHNLWLKVGSVNLAKTMNAKAHHLTLLLRRSCTRLDHYGTLKPTHHHISAAALWRLRLRHSITADFSVHRSSCTLAMIRSELSRLMA